MNPWFRALQVLAVLGVLGTLGGGYALSQMLPERRTEENYAGIDWGMINTLEVLLIPGAATVLLSSALALLAYAAARWRHDNGALRTRSDAASTHAVSD
jgi:hypothetical protein